MSEALSTPTEGLPEGYRMTELGPLPEEWRVVRLGEVATIKAGGSAPQGERYFLSGKHPFVRVQHLDVNSDYVRRWDLITDEAVKHYRLQKFPAGTIVFPKSGAAIRLEKRAILPLDAYIVSHLCAVLPANEETDSMFLFYALRSIRFAEGKAEGYPVLNLSEIREVLIPLPPLAEQRAIAHVLKTVQEAKQATERVIAAARELKKSLMRHLFTYGPVPVGADVGARHAVPLQETELGPLPAHWRVVRLGEVVKLIRGVSWGKRDESPTGVPVIAIPNIKEGRVNFDIHYRITKRISEDKRLVENDILLVGSSGSVHNVGRVSLVSSIPFQQVTFASFLVKAIPININRLFLFFLLQSSAVDFSACSKRAADGKYNLQVQQLSEYSIPLPPLAEQQEIARILQAVDAKIRAEEARQAALEGLFRSLLHHLMTARIRLPKEFIEQFAEGKP